MQSEDIAEFREMEWFGRRVKESCYMLSEHALRFMVSGTISVRDIETVLLTGRVLEEHRNPMRAASYIVYGASGGKDIHIVCADGGNNCLVVLLAYLPAMPVWSSPMQRRNLGGETMTDHIGFCFFCGGTLEEIVAGNYDYRHEGRMYVIKRLPATLCAQCGEKYIRADVGKKIDALINGKTFTGTEMVHVVDYELEKDMF
jgi:YgiT-type zinc finger domain-containing protein